MNGVGYAVISAKISHNGASAKAGKPQTETTPDSDAIPVVDQDGTTMVSGEIIVRENHFSKGEPTTSAAQTDESLTQAEKEFTTVLPDSISLKEDHFSADPFKLLHEARMREKFDRSSSLITPTVLNDASAPNESVVLAELEKFVEAGLISPSITRNPSVVNDEDRIEQSARRESVLKKLSDAGVDLPLGIENLTGLQVRILETGVVQEGVINGSIKLSDIVNYSPQQESNLLDEGLMDFVRTGKASYEDVLNVTWEQEGALSFQYVRDEVHKPKGEGLTFFEAANLTRFQSENLSLSHVQDSIENGWISTKDATNLSRPQRTAVARLLDEFRQLENVSEQNSSEMGAAIAAIVSNPDQYTIPKAPRSELNNVKPEVEYMETNIDGMVHHENLLTAG